MDDSETTFVKRFLRHIQAIVIFFLPLICLAVFLQWESIGISFRLLFSAICVIIQLILIIRILPWFGDFFFRLLHCGYGANSEDEMITQAKRMCYEGDKSGAIQLFEAYRKKHAGNIRTWIQESSFLLDLQEYHQAIDLLEEGLRYSMFWSKENKALFYFKIASIYANHLLNNNKAIDYYRLAASKYPSTAYGRAAKEKLARLDR